MKTLIKTMVFLLAVTMAMAAQAGGQRTFTVNGVSFTMVQVEGGTFTMGATAEQGNTYDSDERPTHQVTLSDFMIGQSEVTQGLWQAVMGSNPSYFSSRNGYDNNPLRPVEYVSWNDCQTFITKLNQLTGETFRLPTEAEWEFAARGGTLSRGYKFSGSNTINDVAWYDENANFVGSSSPNYGTHAVATKAANELGLYDMSGNVWEWCQDWYGSYSSEPQTNPVSPSSGTNRIFRGGCWRYDMICSTVSQRGGELDSPNATLDYLGLRLAMTAPIADQTETVQIGDGSEKNEVLPILNWQMQSYQGNEVIYLKEELGLRKGDLITSLSYHCVQGSAKGGNFNIRIKNTNKTEIYRGATDDQDPSVLLVKNNDKVYGNVQLGSYSAGEWITFNLTEPFRYDGENIVVDIRNTQPGQRQGWCYFASTTVSQPHRALAWRNANAENLTGFIPTQGMSGPDYGLWLDKDDTDVDSRIPNTKISFIRKYIATGLALDKSSLSLIVGSGATLNATIIPDNVSNKTLNWTSSDPNIASVDANGNVVANDEGTAIITVSTTDGSDLSASCTVVCQYGDTRTVLIGTGGASTEGAPICNWCMTDYQGNESLYLRDELKMKKGDIITSLSYHCVGGSAGGGLFNVRIINTSLNELCGTDHDIYNNDPSILKVKYEDTVYGTVQLGGYSSGDWVTFNLSKPFVYDGENIIVDIRNVEKGSRSGWVYFETTPGIEHRTFVWLHALDEAVTGFNSSDCVHNDNNLLNVLITYAPNAVDYVYASELSLNKTETFLAVNGTEQLVATIEPENVTTKTLRWTSSNPAVATVDGTGMVRALNRGTAVITATTTDGSELSASCTIVVTSIYALLTDTLTHVRGDAATVVDLPIVMVNKNDIAGLQFELSLPDGVSMVMTNGVPAVTLDDNRKSRDHSVFASRLSNGNYRVLVSSPTNKKLKGNNGVVLHLNLELAQYHGSGDKTLRFTNINLVEPDETQHAIDDFTSIARLCYVLGDADADTHVDAGDYMATVLSIMEQPVVRFYSDAADVNNDSGINITDLIGITNIALGIRSAEVKHAPAVGRTAEPSVSLTPADDRAACDIVMHNSLPMAGMQFDVTLPEGMRIEGAEALGRATGWQVATADLGNGKTRVLMSHFGDKNITAGDDAIIRLTLNGTAKSDSECEIGGIAIAQRDLTTFHPSPFKIAVTGIDDLANNGKASIYAQGGNVIIESGEAGEAQLVMLNGMTRPLHVSAGRNVYPINNSGVYVVRFNGVTAKLQL